jgi:type IV pilus assembly protein PilW
LARTRNSGGFSLIELLVSMAIGLVIMVAVMSAYLGSAGAGRMAEAQSRMNEDGQTALGILAQHIRMSGNNPDQPNRVDSINPALTSVRNPVYGVTSHVLSGTATTSNFSIRGCDGTFTDITSALALDNLTCVAGGTSTVADSIAVSYEADRFNTIPTNAGRPTDCLGRATPIVTAALPTIVAGTSTMANVTYTVADNRFYIATPGEPAPKSLYCKGNGDANPQPLVENIDTMQFQYGTLSTATTSTTATVAGYLHATEVDGLVTVPPDASGATQWGKVVTVRICVLVRSEAEVAPDAASAQYLDCAGALVTNPPDLRLRRAYTTTVVLRNRRL